jgi:steroid delta-isomerase-like uncharacterized protein
MKNRTTLKQKMDRNMTRIVFRLIKAVVMIFGTASIIGFSCMRADDNSTRIANAYIDFWNSHDANSASGLFVDSVAYDDQGLGIFCNGITELEAFANRYFQVASEDSHFELVASHICGDHGTIEWIMTFTTTENFWGPTPGKKVKVRGVGVIQLVGDKIARCTDYYDVATMLRQSGGEL